ncbi:MAG: hypothetical protein WCG87_00705 [Bacteroidota bacterium]
MLKKQHFYKLIFFSTLLFAVNTGCQKNNGIDNNNIVKTPYSMYVADSAGTLWNTNGDKIDANLEKYKSISFFTDGYASRSLIISDSNLIWVKQNAFLSSPYMRNFNQTHGYINPNAFWQPLQLQVNDQNRNFICVVDPDPSHIGRIYGNGIAYNDSNGDFARWHPDTTWDSLTGPINITSLQELRNGTLVCYDHINHRFFVRSYKTNKWHEKFPLTDSVTHVPINVLPNGSFFLSHINNLVVAVDYSGASGAWYSVDTGVTWKQYAGLPVGRRLYCAEAPFDKVLMIGVDTLGVYLCKNDDAYTSTPTFYTSNDGFRSPYTSVRGIAGKYNAYKNSIEDDFIYVATSTGVYKSSDLGKTWVLSKEGNYVTIY